MTAIEGFVLAGGQSRRMGENKAHLRLGSMTLAERAVGILAGIADPVFIVGDLPGGSGSIRRIDDEFAGTGRSGSVIGLYTALHNAKSEWAAILACDLPMVRPDLFIKMVSLCEQLENDPNQTTDAILPQQPDGRIQPLCGLYRTRRCLPEVRQMISGENWRLQDLDKRLNVYILKFSEYADIEGAQNCFLNVNTPEEFQMAVVCHASQPADENKGK